MTDVAWRLRPSTADDRGFIVDLNRVAMGPYLETTFGWDDTAQRSYFEESFDAGGGQLIQVDGLDVGELLVEERPDELFVGRLALLPDWQGRGIGSAILRMLAERARGTNRAIVLDVFRANTRAARLYESLGFVRTAETDTEVSMRLEPKL